MGEGGAGSDCVDGVLGRVRRVGDGRRRSWTLMRPEGAPIA